MKVVQLQYSLNPSGDFARRFHQEFLKAGLDSSLLSLFSDVAPDERTKTLGKKERMLAKVNNEAQRLLTRKVKKNYGQFSYPVVGNNISKLKQVQEADVIFLHWVLHGFLSLRNMEQLAALGKPVIFILHDMWSITGGCHYSFDCERYQTGCHSCPMFESGKRHDLSTSGYLKKQKFYARYDNLYFVSPSSWLSDCAKASGLTKDKPVYHIPNVLNRKLFKPISKDIARHILNIRQDRTIIAFGAVAVNSPFKGWKYLQEAMEILSKETKGREFSVLIFGNADKTAIAKAIPFDTIIMGRVQDEHAMALIYNAADVFIAPSLADNLPYTIYESLACGTPVVAFNTGGIPDLIQHRKNGYLAEYRNAEDVTRGVHYCLDHRLRGHLSADLDNTAIVQSFMDLMENALGRTSKPRDLEPVEDLTH